MITRDRTNIPIPLSLLTNECNDNLLKVIDDITSGNPATIHLGKRNISASHYRGSFINPDGTVVQDVAEALGRLYEWKCAFCESKRFKPQVEHFRPKKYVTGLNGYSGYYWLCYEWTNLLPCCKDCNETKGTSFPIQNENNRVYSPSYLLNGQLEYNTHAYLDSPLIDENPSLLHPEYCNPESCFSYNSKGEIRGIDINGLGEITKREIGLDSKDLNFFRQKEIDICVEFIEMAFVYNGGPMFIGVLNKIRDRALNTELEYTLLYRNIYNNFLDIIVPLLSDSIQYEATELYTQNYTPIDI